MQKLVKTINFRIFWSPDFNQTTVNCVDPHRNEWKAGIQVRKSMINPDQSQNKFQNLDQG